jgi:O-antigen/teichoic acid export membrane protein
LIMLIALFEIFKSYGIVNAWGTGLLVSLIIGVSIFIPKIYHGYLFKPVFYWKEMKEIIRYSIPNSIYVFLWQITGRILPLLILQLIGAEDSAYFYIAWTIATTISLIPWSISGALFAESSNDDKNLKPQLIRSLMLVLLILIPIIIIVIIIGSQILSIFGANYAIYSSNLLKIWTLSLLPSSINQIFITNLRIKNKLKIIFMIGVFISGFAILTSLFLLPRIGIIGAGISWLTCQSIVAIWVLTKYGWGRILMKQILLTFNRKILPIE